MIRQNLTPQKAIILLLFSAVLFMAGAVWYSYNYWFTRNAILASGQIVDVVSSGKTDHPVIQFTTADGVVVEFTSVSGQNASAFTIGKPVEVYYDPTSPQRARLNSFMSLWFGPMMLNVVGLIDAVVGIVLYAVLRHKAENIAKPT